MANEVVYTGYGLLNSIIGGFLFGLGLGGAGAVFHYCFHLSLLG